MKVTATSFTVAEYCAQMQTGTITTNRSYQRSSKVWPPAARAYLIDTILLGYPMPKMSLFQITDLKSRKTIKEIVDGQQRSQAILDFFEDRLRISGKSTFSGKKYSQLDEPDQKSFLDYQLSSDIFVGATEEDIRQVFRRINSYTVPLNPQEKRHAVYQGLFKWFVVDLSERYAQMLKSIGVFNESQLSRMSDAALMTELTLAMLAGIDHASERKLDNFYKSRDPEFQEASGISLRLDSAFRQILAWEPLHQGPLMKPYNYYCLVLAISHSLDPIEPLNAVYAVRPQAAFERDVVLTNLGYLAAALDQPTDSVGGDLTEFVVACSKATNRMNPRKTRFVWFCKALEPRLLQ